MAYLGGLAGGLAHEIRNPLSTMKVNLQLLRDDLENKTDQGKLRAVRRVNTVEQAVRRLEEIVNDFLNFARGFELELKPMDVNKVVEEVVVFVEPEAQRHRIRIRTAFGTALSPLNVDRSYLQQALLNLFLNARQAIEETDEPGEIFVTTREAGGEIIINVTDTGPGIPSEDAPRVFEAYFSTKKGGTGLGLPTSRRIIEEHGGSLSVESEPGKGTSFSIHLPLSKDDGSDPTSG